MVANQEPGFDLGGRLTHQTAGRDVAFAPRAGLAYSLPSNKMVVRAGAGLIYGHVPLLATDFAGYQAVLAIHAEGSIEAEKLAMVREHDSARCLKLAKRLAGIQ